MPTYRSFRNDDPPAIRDLWNLAADENPRAAIVRSCDMLENYVFSKPFFDPNSLTVAEEGEADHRLLPRRLRLRSRSGRTRSHTRFHLPALRPTRFPSARRRNRTRQASGSVSPRRRRDQRLRRSVHPATTPSDSASTAAPERPASLKKTRPRSDSFANSVTRRRKPPRSTASVSTSISTAPAILGFRSFAER